ncbi:unnamed protein product [Zymoseptoria tritici ST99CH_1A5]|uniref:Suppressor of anucleate metulae protein B n=3 Tax=Zymoseptoria tritici TaxID=1047171 RepID=F9XH49_ZYMTI|nr:uncharacterized protein MYCGRDRAFT_95041 [Zymoseptoria tritici IPO323]EGP84943.1 hypothetical protein MYCGRDRAFT_95041 [Zymoseptoria tritici IPO323]SMQ53218.1 unnamed protein product [Zymoseptoria tritici ST99CH_3D7]SMR59658.1 unnamed protein product [Zymoseptoria tritici ST99CH_3D1]SMY26848.1 unnamed protein product [Zymoseptoria tritici ST99CH_1A5]
MDIHSLAKMDIGASKQQSNFAKAQKPRSATQQSKPNEVNSDPCTTCAQACPKPILICTECADGTDQHGTATTTIYCDTKCRAADTKHAKLCAVKNQQKELHRSGEILQAIWFIWREVAFDMKLSHIEKKKAASGEDLLFFHEGDYTDHNEGPLYPLPALANMDEKDKQAVITLNSCGDAMGFLHGLSKKLLAGISDGIWENYAAVKESDYYVHQVRCTGEPFKFSPIHQYLTTRLSTNGKIYVLDPSGAQLGQHQAVLAPGRRLQWMTNNVQVAEHGACAINSAVMRNRHPNDAPPSTDFRVGHVQEAVCQKVMKVVEVWEQSRTSLQQLRREDRAKYVTARDSLLAFIRVSLRKWVADYTSGAITVHIPEYQRPGPDTFKPTPYIQSKAGKSKKRNDAIDPSDICGTPQFFAKLASQGVNIHYA